MNRAITFYENQLAIARESEHPIGAGNALGNLGNTYAFLGDDEKAISCFEAALTIFESIESPNAAKAREQLAKLRVTAVVLEQDTPMKVREFVRTVVEIHRSKGLQAAKQFDLLGKMTRDNNYSSSTRELAGVLQKYMSGIKYPDLSALPEEFEAIVRDELDR